MFLLKGFAESSSEACDHKWQSLLTNLATPPLFTTLRYNTCKYQSQTVLQALQDELEKVIVRISKCSSKTSECISYCTCITSYFSILLFQVVAVVYTLTGLTVRQNTEDVSLKVKIF